MAETDILANLPDPETLRPEAATQVIGEIASAYYKAAPDVLPIDRDSYLRTIQPYLGRVPLGPSFYELEWEDCDGK